MSHRRPSRPWSRQLTTTLLQSMTALQMPYAARPCRPRLFPALAAGLTARHPTSLPFHGDWAHTLGGPPWQPLSLPTHRDASQADQRAGQHETLVAAARAEMGLGEGRRDRALRTGAGAMAADGAARTVRVSFLGQAR